MIEIKKPIKIKSNNGKANGISWWSRIFMPKTEEKSFNIKSIISALQQGKKR